MEPMKILQMADPVRYSRMNTAELRETFLVENLFQPGAVNTVYIDLDRTVIGSAVPTLEPLSLGTYPELRSRFFAERREIGVLNIGGPGTITIDGQAYPMPPRACLYAGRGSESITFASAAGSPPAEYYFLSYPAHSACPPAVVLKEHAETSDLGAPETCNRRRIHRCIHSGGARSCQLVMGFTEIATGSNWNTMPAHTHMRRSEVYLYFDLGPGDRVLHMMGPAAETRHIMVANKQAVISPGWSIHAGVGTSSYTFCWGMGGENQVFSDMDPVPVESLK
jgi:4-deoxy-L-threo-5-hexosulose-uronate ketol-isomerase